MACRALVEAMPDGQASEAALSSASEASSDCVERLTTRSEGGRDTWVDMLDTLLLAMSRVGPFCTPQVRTYCDLSFRLEAELRRTLQRETRLLDCLASSRARESRLEVAAQDQHRRLQATMLALQWAQQQASSQEATAQHMAHRLSQVDLLYGLPDEQTVTRLRDGPSCTGC